MTKKESQKLLDIKFNQRKAHLSREMEQQGIKRIYGLVISQRFGSSIEDDCYELIVDQHADIDIWDCNIDLIALCWNNQSVLDRESSILLYVLSETYEYVIYKSGEVKQSFCLSLAPKRDPATGELVKRNSSELFKLYSCFKETLLQLTKNRDNELVNIFYCAETFNS